MADLNEDALAVALAKAKALVPDAKFDSIVRSNCIVIFSRLMVKFAGLRCIEGSSCREDGCPCRSLGWSGRYVQ